MRFIKLVNANFEEYLAVFLLCILVLLGFLQVLFRFLFNFSLDWTEELSRYIFICLVYVAASLAVQKRRHVRVEIIDMLLGPKALHYLNILVQCVWMAFSILIAVEGYDVAQNELTQLSPALGVSMAIFYGIIPFGFGLMSLRLLQNIVADIRKGGQV